MRRVEASYWLVSTAQRCALVGAAYLAVVGSLRALCSQDFLQQLCDTLLHELKRPQDPLQVLC